MDGGSVATFAGAFSLSLAYNLVPGPVTVATLQRGTRRGVRGALAVRLGALGGSLTWAVAGFTGAGVVAQSPPARFLLGATGTAVLLWLAWRALRPAGRGVARDARPAGRRGDALAGALIALASPLEAAFWLGIGGAVVADATTAGRIAEASAFLGGFIAADLLATAAFAALVGWGRCVASGRVARAANLCCVAALGWFALGPLVRAIPL